MKWLFNAALLALDAEGAQGPARGAGVPEQLLRDLHVDEA